jgi:hypothetical protein
MDAYDQAYQALSGEVWDDYYLNPDTSGNGKTIPLPKFDE